MVNPDAPPDGGQVGGWLPRRKGFGAERAFGTVTLLAGSMVLVIIVAITVFLIAKAIPALRADTANFITTTDSPAALDAIRREQPDVILLDIMMPQVSGLDILQAVRADPELSHLPVIILTASTDADGVLVVSVWRDADGHVSLVRLTMTEPGGGSDTVRVSSTSSDALVSIEEWLASFGS